MIKINQNLIIKKENDFISTNEIQIFEKNQKILLPIEYKSFLIKCNGGYVGKNKLSFVYKYKDINFMSEEEKDSFINNFFSIEKISILIDIKNKFELENLIKEVETVIRIL